MSQSLTPKVELKIQKDIRQAEDDLVTAIETALDTCDYPKQGKDKLEEAQFRNLVRVADTTDSPEVVKNFLCYQVGRDNKWGTGKNSLAAKIIHDIDNDLKTQANNIAKNYSGVNFKPIWIEIIRRYLGYGSRHLKYLNKISEQKLEPIIPPRTK
ncbi:hypothetical protein NIES4075_63300 [Tolypothrix sp. NIES-4075]|uniref:hypothetical protein n=1 Tax=Tolypothrix sp. NIES-4075 TaxID=2005459 RepID=UPI000B5C6AC2|nr:hypothetical protein [Tolypothrix sp. NIES-4075]GAX45309.1 hypothetical protein NIES4075_63300 [Tolypothrix sp. NIES-4075]